MNAVALRLTLAVVGLLIAGASMVVPDGLRALRLTVAENDPLQLAEMALDEAFTPAVAAREVEAALRDGDPDLAQSFLELADSRNVALDPALRQRVADDGSAAAVAGRSAARFLQGALTGQPDDAASLMGTVAGDLLVWGDIRDMVRETAHLMRGESADGLVLGLACVGLAITGGTYASLGAAAPARVGVTLVKAASRTGRLTARMTEALRRPLRESIDADALRRAFAPGAWLQPAVAVRSARAAVKIDKAEGLVRLVGDLGRVQGRAGTRAALDGLRIAESPRDVARLARLAEGMGGKTRAVLKLLGRGAIALTIGALQLASSMFWALLSLIGVCAALKRLVERATLTVLYRRKLRRARLVAAGPGGMPGWADAH